MPAGGLGAAARTACMDANACMHARVRTWSVCVVPVHQECRRCRRLAQTAALATVPIIIIIIIIITIIIIIIIINNINNNNNNNNNNNILEDCCVGKECPS